MLLPITVGAEAVISAPAAVAGVTAYPPSFFTSARPTTAYDMLQHVPGFTFSDGDTVRGFSGAAGNVLLNGQRPSSKTDALSDVFKRIQATAVARIELIRGGAPGIDMQGQSVVANVVLSTEAQTTRTVAFALVIPPNGQAKPQLRLEGSRRANGRVLEGTAVTYLTYSDETGHGTHLVRDGSGALVERGGINVRTPVKGLDAHGSYTTPLWLGQSRFNAAFKTETYHYDETDQDNDPSGALIGRDYDNERQNDTHGELGGDYEMALGPRTKFKILAIQSYKHIHYGAGSLDHGVAYDFGERATSGESIARATLTWTRSEHLSLEGGAEGAFNFLDESVLLLQDHVPIPLPAASVLVEERRAEALATAVWRPSPRLNVELGGKVDTSTISQSGDTSLSRSFVYPKPRLLVTWAPSPANQLRLRIEREVGQLDFTDFISSAALQTGSVNGGNPNLAPDQTWVYEAALEHDFWGSAAGVLTLRHKAISDVVDRIPLADGLDAAGDIGSGTADQLETNLTLPTDKFGLKGGQFRADVTWTKSEVTDPTTGQKRPISGLHPVDGTVSYTQDIPRLKATFGIDASLRYQETYYRIDEVRTLPRNETYWTAHMDFKPKPGLSIYVEATNFTAADERRYRLIYDGLRSAGDVAYASEWRLHRQPSLFIRVKRTI